MTAPTAQCGPWTAPSFDGPLADALLHAAATAFLALEAEALDDRRFGDWGALIDDAFVYQVPVPVLHDSAAAPRHHIGSLLIDEDKQSIMGLWFRRFEEEAYDSAWGDHPPVRQRHFVSNVRVRHLDEDRLGVRSNVRLHMVRQLSQTGVLTAERFDVIKRRGERFTLLSRFAILDDLVLDAPQLRVML
jgi:3-phenylpropionate/cinnamic acid dioxygenase small subunit